MNSTNDILSIKGVGEKTARLFRKIGIDTVEDLIHDYPRDYVVYPEPKKLKAAQDGEMISESDNWNRKGSRRTGYGSLNLFQYALPEIQARLRSLLSFLWETAEGARAVSYGAAGDL